MRLNPFLLVLLVIAVLAVGHLAQRLALQGELADPRRTILRLTSEDGDLAAALAQADRGDSLPLSTWLTRQALPQRERLGEAILGEMLMKTGQERLDDGELWPWRHRLLAFIHISTGSPTLDDRLTNALAYLLLTGTAQPSATDLELARKLVARLDDRGRSELPHPLLDTVGCYHYLAGDPAKARDAFAKALDLLTKEPDTNQPWLVRELERLYRFRHQAALQALALPKGVPPPPLPRAPLSRQNPSPGSATAPTPEAP